MAEGDGLSGMPPDRAGLRRVLLVVSIGVAIVAAGALGAWALFSRGEDEQTADGGKPSYEHAQPTEPKGSSEPPGTTTSASVDASGSALETDVASAEESATSPATVSPPAVVVAVGRKPYVAYRLGGKIWVAREDGSSPKAVTGSRSGVFALSPDARTLAYVDYTAGKLALVDIAKSTVTNVCAAVQVTPVWSSDSKQVFFVRDAAEHRLALWRVLRTGKDAAIVAPSSEPAVSPDGRVVAVVGPGAASSTGPVKIPLMRDGKPWRTAVAPGSVTDVVLGADRAYVAVAPGVDPQSGEQVEGIWVLPFDPNTKPSRIVGPTATEDRTSFGMLTLSPDAIWLAYVRAGDDGYSRMSVVKTTGGEPYGVSARRDCYPLGWAADSSAVFYIEGNAWQGESTALVRLNSSGSGRAVLVSGAGR